MSEKFASLLAACAVTFAAFAVTTPVSAKEPITVVAPSEDVPVRYVSYRDLNLTQAEDEKALVRRVRFAAKGVCYDSGLNITAAGSSFMRCRANAWLGAKPQIERAVLRAREIASNGFSAIAPVAITVSAQ